MVRRKKNGKLLMAPYQAPAEQKEALKPAPAGKKLTPYQCYQIGQQPYQIGQNFCLFQPELCSPGPSEKFLMAPYQAPAEQKEALKPAPAGKN